MTPHPVEERMSGLEALTATGFLLSSLSEPVRLWRRGDSGASRPHSLGQACEFPVSPFLATRSIRVPSTRNKRSELYYQEVNPLIWVIGTTTAQRRTSGRYSATVVLEEQTMKCERAIAKEEPRKHERASKREKSKQDERAKSSEKPIPGERASNGEKPNRTKRAMIEEKPRAYERASNGEKPTSPERVSQSRPKSKEQSMTEATAVSSTEALGFLIDTLLRIEKMRVSAQVRESHLEKADRQCEQTIAVRDELDELEDRLTKRVATVIKEHPAYPWFSKVKGIGKENIGKVVGQIDIERAKYISSLWKFAGYHVVDGEAPRSKKGQKRSYNATLRVMCYRVGGSLMKARGAYYDYYMKEKESYVRRFMGEGKEILPAEEIGRRTGQRQDTEEYVSEGHIHMMALRKMIKLFLAHLWIEWRRGEGLPVTEPYVIASEDHPTHTHTIDPWEMVAE